MSQQQHEKTIFILNMDAYSMALSAHEQTAALASLAGMAKPEQTISSDEWFVLLKPISDQLGILAKMLEHDALEGVWQLTTKAK